MVTVLNVSNIVLIIGVSLLVFISLCYKILIPDSSKLILNSDNKSAVYY